jgi:hypothetical protein
MIATFHLKPTELNPALLEKLSKLFSDEEHVHITVSSDDDMDYPYNNPTQTQYLLEAIRKINNREGLIEMDLADLQ